MKPPASIAVPLLAVTLWTGCGTTPVGAPRNLSLAKQDVDHYARSGRYEADLSAVCSRASAWIRQRSADGGESLAVVFDIDETCLSNLEHMRESDWGYHQERWSEWVAEAEAPAIEPMREVYQTAVSRGIAVFFITGRRESEQAATARNLRRRGFGRWHELITKADGAKESAESFKLGARQRIAARGYTIIANIGDQRSDLAGGGAERTFKLPNPFYQIH